ncbi:hypothetical protein CAPTEDRAFT_220945 [Capitella teleta]|uniref:Uncharacterized protein n=1 Tax=Capitella teleta TaxID=283909 RepID=R7TY37_CAPTE|nr:hypothetical protein CAPTEDRAFT_220945 [Capitella teleta]|eukprot:ELT98798.1 hypothetical protein CAPTEDRAFT_220945 [Capitella teleta]
MCMLFVFINNDPKENEFNVIVANNRDEHYERRTKPAHFWSEECLGGIDAHHGREGGTWLGMSKRRRIASLLNILQYPFGPDPSKKGRGFLVKDFLTNEESVESYLSRIATEGHSYGGFHLVCVDYRCGDHFLYYSFTCISIFTNCKCYNRQWAKAAYARPLFTDIVARLNSTQKQNELKLSLLRLLSDDTQTLPDPALEEQAGEALPHHIIAERSAVHVTSASINYGTRTNSIILVDKSGNCEFFERTMREPIDKDAIVWDTKSFQFKMQN